MHKRCTGDTTWRGRRVWNRSGVLTWRFTAHHDEKTHTHYYATTEIWSFMFSYLASLFFSLLFQIPFRATHSRSVSLSLSEPFSFSPLIHDFVWSLVVRLHVPEHKRVVKSRSISWLAAGELDWHYCTESMFTPHHFQCLVLASTVKDTYTFKLQ